MSSYDWMGDALCAQTGPDVFFPEKPGQNVTKARAICAMCPVRIECGDHAVHLEGNTSQEHRHGAWAGLSARQRTNQRQGAMPADVRDAQILRLSERDMSAVEIAAQLGCNERTVFRVRAAHRQREAKA